MYVCLLQRSIELAKDMAELNRQLRLRAQKQRQKQQEKGVAAAATTAGAGAEDEQQQAAVSVHGATAPVVSVDTERPQGLAGQGDALEGPGSSVGDAAAAAVATTSSVAMGTEDGRWSGADVDLRVDGGLSELKLGRQGPGGMTGKLEGTIAALDSLLGQMGEDPPPSGA